MYHCAGNVPSLAVWGRRDRAAPQDGLVLHEVLLATGEDRAVVDQELASHVRVRDDDIELIAAKERIEGTKLLRPCVQSAFGVVREERETKERTRRNRVAVLIHQIFAEEERKDDVQGGRYNQDESQVRIETL